MSEIESLPYADIAEQLALIEQYLRDHPPTAGALAVERSLDALACARALVVEVAELANGHTTATEG